VLLKNILKVHNRIKSKLGTQLFKKNYYEFQFHNTSVIFSNQFKIITLGKLSFKNISPDYQIFALKFSINFQKVTELMNYKNFCKSNHFFCVFLKNSTVAPKNAGIATFTIQSQLEAASIAD